MISSESALPATGLSERYEELRDRAATSGAARDESWSVLVRSGVATWMKRRPSDKTRYEQRPPAGLGHRGTRDEMVLVLAGMALGSTKEVRA